MPRQRHEHQTNRPAANDQQTLPGLRIHLLPSLRHAGQRLGQRRVGESRPRFEAQEVLLHHAGGDDNRFGISAIEKKEVVAKIFLALLAIAAIAARRGIGRHHPVPHPPAPDTGSHFANVPGQFVAKDRGRRDHFRMITPPEDLQVSPARQRRLNGDTHFAWFERGRRHFHHPQIFLSMEHGCFHPRENSLPGRQFKQ